MYTEALRAKDIHSLTEVRKFTFALGVQNSLMMKQLARLSVNDRAEVAGGIIVAAVARDTVVALLSGLLGLLVNRIKNRG
jgi:hypothetical protein